MEYPAHIRTMPDGTKKIQTVKSHCLATARIASEALESIGLKNCAYLAGVLHDMGKYTSEFKEYITAASDGLPTKGTVIHSFQAVRFLLERYGDDCDRVKNMTAEILASVVGSHHGLFDCLDAEGNSGFEHRIKKDGISYEEARLNYLSYCADEAELNELFSSAKSEIDRMIKTITELTQNTENDDLYYVQCGFYVGLLTRLILSAVINGDRTDTAAFMTGISPATQAASWSIWDGYPELLERKLQKLPCDTPIGAARSRISDICKKAADMPGGIFRLNAPTGGGKTLSSLRFALSHAKTHNKSRIIFTSPLLSILDQNAQVIREYVQNDDIISEHHSNVIHRENDEERSLDERDFLMQDWSSPIIITTLVQLLNTLFSGKTSCIRRFRSLCNSIIVIDEVQTVPTKMLSLFSLAVNFLAYICGATVVLCSATQPCLEATEHPFCGVVRDILPYDKELWDVFKRTVIENIGEMSLDEISGYAESISNDVRSLLIVCNKKDEAETIFRALDIGDQSVFYLSAALCTAHRRVVIDELKKRLARGERTICVSTQVIEAGVDISFERVIRLAAGMDSVIQAAGRCNRNGECPEPSPVYVASVKNENLRHLSEIQDGKAATAKLFSESQYADDPDSEKAIKFYYEKLYGSMPVGHRDYYDEKLRCTLLSLLSVNPRESTDGRYMRQAFKTAGDAFCVFDDDTTDVLCGYGEGANIASELAGERAERDPAFLRSLVEKAKPYMVSLRSYQLKRLEEDDAILSHNGVYILRGHYDDMTGFNLNDNELEFMEV